MKLLGSFILTAVLSGCVGAPSSNDDLASGEGIERESNAGSARGRLTVLGGVTEGSNDFELTLSATAPFASATLQALDAVMPSHGHRAEPARIEGVTTGYRIVDLPLSMPGVWQLRGELVVDDRPDQITFEVDVP